MDGNQLILRRLGAWPRVLVLIVALVGPTGCGQAPTRPDAVESELQTLSNDELAFLADWDGPRDTREYSSEVARAWFDLSYNLVKVERWSPPVASRFWGYAGVTLYEATRPGIAGSASLRGQIEGLDNLPHPQGRAYHWPTVANAALHTLFSGLFSAASAPSLAQINTLYHQSAAEFQQELPHGIFRRSERFGREIGGAILEWSNGDGYATNNNCSYTPPVGEGLWVPTPPDFAPPLQPCWGQLRTCVVDEGNSCDPGPHPPYSTVPGSAFYNEGLEVYETVANLTDEQRAIAIFWADTPGQTGTPPGHWIAILGQILGEPGYGLDVAAEAYARVGLAEMDAFICCWFVKYELNLLRPITYIRNLFDSGWNSPIPTPPFPEYTSGHSTQSAAVAQVLTDMFGDVSFTDHTHDALGYPPRSFDTFWEAAEEAAISRLYGGIHFRSAIENGMNQGRCIGEGVSALNFQNGVL